MTTEATITVARIIRNGVERKQWRSATEKEVRSYARSQGAGREEVERLLAEVRRQYDEAGAGYSGRFQ